MQMNIIVRYRWAFLSFLHFKRHLYSVKVQLYPLLATDDCTPIVVPVFFFCHRYVVSRPEQYWHWYWKVNIDSIFNLCYNDSFLVAWLDLALISQGTGKSNKRKIWNIKGISSSACGNFPWLWEKDFIKRIVLKWRRTQSLSLALFCSNVAYSVVQYIGKNWVFRFLPILTFYILSFPPKLSQHL